MTVASLRGPLSLPPAPRAAVVVLVLGAAPIVGLAALAAAASVNSSPAVFLGTGLVAFLLAAAAGTELVARCSEAHVRGRQRLAASVGAGLGVTAFTLTALLPLGDPRLAPTPVRGMATWRLATGSSIAYVHVPSRRPAPRATPVVFLHGGPGVPDLHGDSRYFGQLASDGFDVYVYAQVGSGSSSRLADPRQYTVARHVRDLEAIRERIGAERLILLGHSWGGLIAATYAAHHPRRVARLVLSSPHPLDPADASGGNLRNRLSFWERARVYSLLARPRALLAYGLLQVNPRAAIALAGDAEMDGRFDRVYNRSRASLHCVGRPPGPELHGLGFYSNQFPQSAAASRAADVRPALSRLTTPTLILKGSCDYLSWSSAISYRRALRASRLVYLRGVGHNAYQDRPRAFLELVRAFLTGRPLPITPWASERAPADYEGPA
jgi:proline iminopeptidase